ncbi:MAG TPA: zinc ribbon domain-containing protein [Saprospiraceae bacterium]|nr:zinc ribbon domain-containing protein [Saprospiraceae bacterium]
MKCKNCNAELEPGTVFCGNCGTKQEEPIQTFSTPSNIIPENQINPQIEQVKTFFKNNLIGIVKSIFIEPISGVSKIFENTAQEAYRQAVTLILTTGILYIILPLLFSGRANEFTPEGFGFFIKIGVIIIIILVLISVFTFLAKSISGKADFKNELLTGGLCGIPLMIFLGIISILVLFNSNMSVFGILTQMTSGNMIVNLCSIYLFLMLINIVQQSLKTANTNDGLSWWISPLIIFASFYVGFRISIDLLY